MAQFFAFSASFSLIDDALSSEPTNKRVREESDCSILARGRSISGARCCRAMDSPSLTSVPRLSIRGIFVHGGAVCCRGVLVHCLSRLGAEASILTTELQCRDGVLATWACERRHAVHRLDGVMSHRFKCSRLSGYCPEPKSLV
jgi:hypothetical protein